MTFLSQLELSRTDLQKCTHIWENWKKENCDHTICPFLSILFYITQPNKAWLFEKFIFELEASYSFKTTCILVRQVITLKKSGGAISKICLISRSPICTLLILISASVKMAGTSATEVYNCMKVDTTGELLI